MAEPKKISTRIINKHATAAVWNNTNFTPLQGEIVVYDPGYDSTDGKTYSYERMKIGDGSHTIQELPFITENLNLELTAEDNNSLLMWDNDNSTFVSSPLEKGTGDNSLVINEGVASGISSIAGGTTDSSLLQTMGVPSGITLPASQAKGTMSLAFGVDANAESVASISMGYATVAGAKGYYYRGINFTNKTIELSTSRTSLSSPSSINWEVGDKLSIVCNDYYPYTCEITSINGTIITVDSIPFTEDDYHNAYYTNLFNKWVENVLSYTSPEARTIINVNKPTSGTVELGFGAIAIGYQNKASGVFSQSFGYNNISVGNYAFSSGFNTKAIGNQSHAEGSNTVASGYTAHSEGYLSEAIGDQSHAEGYHTIASGSNSHTEGRETEASGISSHAEGYLSKATGEFAHAEGRETKAIGQHSHSEGDGTIASGAQSHAGGIHTIASAIAQTAIGKYNVENMDALFIIGNGNSDTERSNAFEVISTTDGTSIKVGNTVITEAQLQQLLSVLTNNLAEGEY